MSTIELQAKDSGGKRPNVMLILMDDMGFSDPGCYGGDIDTPNIDRLAANGLRYTQFYNTGRCWPTRSSILTGHYAPTVCMDPPMRGYRPSWQRLIPQFLKAADYRSYHSGKWHVMNTKDPAAEGGFDISWGYDIEQLNHFFHQDDGSVKFSATAITDHALDCLRKHQTAHAETPFFHYVCYTTPHFPVQAEQEDIDKYMRRYLDGWDVKRKQRWERQRRMGIVNCDLSTREPDVPAPHYLASKDEWAPLLGPGEIEYAVAWDTLTDEQKRFQATKMAIHAAMVDRTDREIGRLLDQLKAMNVLDDTLILFLSDNGASAEMMIRGQGHDPAAPPGSEKSHLCLGPGWSSCSNAPFRRHKIWVHEGGVSTPLVACWPNGIQARGELRHTPGHCVDFLPTILDLAGIDPADIPQAEGAPPLPGRSLAPTFQADGSLDRDHIYFHHEGNRALRVGDWKVVNESLVNRGTEDDPWALYDLATDRCEMVDLAASMPEKCRELQDLWRAYENLYRTQLA
ncbi:MAG: arylsulfatase [Lentisphaeria bacterium]|nr:arylsulfatase [Lentisphaeria bacterium]